MNMLLIAGVVLFAVWFERRRHAVPTRRTRRSSEDALARTLHPTEPRL
jgi:hypothetical protein